ncbi:MAG: hypothetical protein FJ255_08510 [Phycisphaerae bacterium]|nr:hypothetical protein [Phycisphaerae bacterium]
MSLQKNDGRAGLGREASTPVGSRAGASPGWSRVMGFGEDPLLWSFPVGGVLGAKFRVHALAPIWLLGELINAGRTDRNSLVHVVPALVLVCSLAFVKELARVAAARRSATPIGAVVLWPLGAMAIQSRGPLRAWRAQAAPPAMLAAAGVVMGSLFLLAGGNASLLAFNPLAPQPVIAALATSAQLLSWWGFFAAALLLLANLVPALPMDAGRTLDARLLGSRAAARVLQIQVLGACAAFLAAAFADQPRVLIVAAVACVAGWVSLRRLAFVPVPPAEWRPDPAPPNADLDQILAKVSLHGVASLTDEERAELDRASARLRGRE